MQVDYIALARRGGAKAHPKMDSFDGWLEALRSQQLKAEVNGTSLETNLDGPLVAHHYSGSIMRVCQASCDLCKILESCALETERMEQLQRGAQVQAEQQKAQEIAF